MTNLRSEGTNRFIMSIKLEKVIEEYKFASDKISTQVRTLALGIIALIWLLLIGKDLPFTLTSSVKGQFIIVGFICLLVLIADFVQYLFFFFFANSTIDKAEEMGQEKIKYNYKDYRYAGCKVFFHVKLILLTISALWTSILIIGRIADTF